MRLDKYSVNLQEELGNPDFINYMNYGGMSDEDRERLILYYNQAIELQNNPGGLYYQLAYYMNPIGTSAS